MIIKSNKVPTSINVEWTSFKKELDDMVGVLNSITLPISPTNDVYERKIGELQKIKTEIANLLKFRFGDATIYCNDFRTGLPQIFKDKGYEQNQVQFNQQFRLIVAQYKRDLESTIKLLSVSDLITDPKKTALTVRQNYSAEEVINLLLNKLYIIYDDFAYPVLPILIGNGININRQREEFEIVQILSNRGLVDSNNIGAWADAKLTYEGKLYVEQQLLAVKTNYGKINCDGLLNGNFDRLYEKLKELGLGQEMLFNELDELKEQIDKLDQKNIGQLLKGKLIDLFMSKVISIDTAKYIFSEVVGDNFTITS